MRYRCVRCIPPPKGYLFEADVPVCPRCDAKGTGSVQEIVDVHFIVMDQNGAIYSAQGRQFVACQKKRTCFAEHAMDMFSASGDPRAVTCRSCMGTQWYKDTAKLFPEIEEGERLRKIIEGTGCCG